MTEQPIPDCVINDLPDFTEKGPIQGEKILKRQWSRNRLYQFNRDSYAPCESNMPIPENVWQRIFSKLFIGQKM
jgi:hypothetical protein